MHSPKFVFWNCCHHFYNCSWAIDSVVYFMDAVCDSLCLSHTLCVQCGMAWMVGHFALTHCTKKIRNKKSKPHPIWRFYITRLNEIYRSSVKCTLTGNIVPAFYMTSFFIFREDFVINHMIWMMFKDLGSTDRNGLVVKITSFAFEYFFMLFAIPVSLNTSFTCVHEQWLLPYYR